MLATDGRFAATGDRPAGPLCPVPGDSRVQAVRGLGIGYWALGIGHWTSGIGVGVCCWVRCSAFTHQPFVFMFRHFCLLNSLRLGGYTSDTHGNHPSMGRPPRLREPPRGCWQGVNSEGGRERGSTDLDLDLVADPEARGTPGGSTMASPTTLHIGRPCHMKRQHGAERNCGQRAKGGSKGQEEG